VPRAWTEMRGGWGGWGGCGGGGGGGCSGGGRGGGREMGEKDRVLCLLPVGPGLELFFLNFFPESHRHDTRGREPLPREPSLWLSRKGLFPECLPWHSGN
jgi:hypothetical protein